MDLGPAAEALRATLTGPLKMAPDDVTLLEAADAEGNGQHTKEKVAAAPLQARNHGPRLTAPSRAPSLR